MEPIFKKLIFSAFLFLTVSMALGQRSKPKADQEIKIPMQSAYWQFDTSAAEFITRNGVAAMHLKNGSPVILKNQTFSNGTIEYDVEFGRGFPGINFRMSDDMKNGDDFYLRYFGTTSPDNNFTLQYAAVIDGMSIWDLSNEYQAGATLKIPGWNHVKLVVSGVQMKAYVNDMTHAAMIVPFLEGGRTTGGMFFSGGDVTVANMVIRPDVVEGLSPDKGYAGNYNDTRYIRSWQVSPAIDFPQGKDIVPPLPYMGGARPKADLPDSTTNWTSIVAEERDMINLTRRFGAVQDNGRRLIWLKTTIVADRAQERTLRLGFSDEIWLFVNGQILYTDKNHFGSPGQKSPGGRCTIDNATIRLPLQQGKNEILVGLANYFYGWGIIARLDDVEGIHLSR